MGIETNPERFLILNAAIREQSVERSLPYPGMADIPQGYSGFAAQDALRNQNSWVDICPSYALALLTHRSYRLPEDEETLEILWDEIGGCSTNRWQDVATTVRRAWKWLYVAECDRPA